MAIAVGIGVALGSGVDVFTISGVAVGSAVLVACTLSGVAAVTSVESAVSPTATDSGLAVSPQARIVIRLTTSSINHEFLVKSHLLSDLFSSPG